MSSTFRELRATNLVLQSFAPLLQGKEVLHRTDTDIILSVGSRKADLHNEAVDIYKLCRSFDIRLTVEWVSRDFNKEADELSRIEDCNDYMLDPSWFARLDSCWGPHTIDCFASVKTKQLDRFCRRILNPGCEAVDAFTVMGGRLQLALSSTIPGASCFAPHARRTWRRNPPGPRMAFCALAARSLRQAWFLAWFCDSIPENPTLCDSFYSRGDSKLFFYCGRAIFFFTGFEVVLLWCTCSFVASLECYSLSSYEEWLLLWTSPASCSGCSVYPLYSCYQPVMGVFWWQVSCFVAVSSVAVCYGNSCFFWSTVMVF